MNTYRPHSGDYVRIGRGKAEWRVIAAYPGRVIVSRLVPANTRTGWRTMRRYLDPAKTKFELIRSVDR